MRTYLIRITYMIVLSAVLFQQLSEAQTIEGRPGLRQKSRYISTNSIDRIDFSPYILYAV
jgi:hypothetical protein